MTITVGSSDAIQSNTDSAHAILTAKKAQSQQELEGQMALELIQSASIDSIAPIPVGNSGHNINIKV